MELNGKILEPSKLPSSPEKHENEETTPQESLLEENNNQNDIAEATGEGVFHQLLLTGAVVLVAAAGGMPIVS